MDKIDLTFFEGSYVNFLEISKKDYTHVINYIDIASAMYNEESLITSETFSEVLINLNIFKRIKRIVNYKTSKKRVLYYVNPSNKEEVKENVIEIFYHLLGDKELLNISEYDKRN